MTGPQGSSRSLLATRVVRSDASLGSPRRPGPGLLRRLAPVGVAGVAGRRRFPLAAPSWPEGVPRPAPEPGIGIDYDTAWARRYPVRVARAVLLDNVTRPLATLVASPLVRGLEHLPASDAPVIFAANHTSHVDTPLLLACLPLPFRHRTVVAAASDYFFDRKWKAGLFAFSLAAIPIERTKVNRRSAALAADLLGEGWNLVIFPEGGRSPDGWAQPFRGGAAYLAARTGRPVVPVHLAGTRDLLPKGATALRRARTTVTFGTPIRAEPGEDARQLGGRIERAVAVLSDEHGSDWWSARKRSASGTTPPLQGPTAAPWRRAWSLDPVAPARSGPDGRWPWPGGDRVPER